MYHAGPAGYCNTTLYAGGTVVIMESWDAREFLRTVETHRVTTTFLTPAHFIRLLELPPAVRARCDVSSLRHVIHAGAPCPRVVKQQIIDAFPHVEVWELYGMSEGGATRVSAAEWSERPGTVGLPWPGVEIRIVDTDTGEPLPAGDDGLIYVRPAHGRFRYHNDAAKTAEACGTTTSFTVGDVGHLDEAGYLYLTDRAVRHGDPVRREHLPAGDRGGAAPPPRRWSTARSSASPTTATASSSRRWSRPADDVERRRAPTGASPTTSTRSSARPMIEL